MLRNVSLADTVKEDFAHFLLLAECSFNRLQDKPACDIAEAHRA